MQIRVAVADWPVTPVMSEGNPLVLFVELIVARAIFTLPDVRKAGLLVLPDVV